MGLSQKQFALLLSITPHLGSKGIERILRVNFVQNRSPDEFLALPTDQKSEQYELRETAAAALTVGLKSLLDELEKLENRIRVTGVQVFTLQDAGYPTRLDSFMLEPPALLFAYGNLQLLNQQTYCALASREPSKAGMANIEAVVERMGFERKVLVSGHNTKGYQRASVTALRWGMPRILALDCGLFQGLGDDLKDEPFRIARLYRYQFDPKTDLVISPFRLGDNYIGVNNQIRDELIAALSDQVIAVEVRAGGQMETLAHHALSVGRPVFACRYPDVTLLNEGNHNLLQSGAQLFE